MKKTVKKVMAIILTTILLAGVLPLQSFALFDSLKAPVVESIDFIDGNKAVSMQDLDTYYNELFAMLKDNDISLENLKEYFGGALYDALLSFELSYSWVDYNLDVTLQSGEKFTVPLSDGLIDYNKLYTVYTGAYIRYEDYLEAKENSQTEIEIQLYADVYGYFDEDYSSVFIEPVHDYTCTDTAKLVPCFVKSITPVSEMPNEIYYDDSYIDIEGAEFLIEYADGTTKTDKVSQEIIFPTEAAGTAEVNYYLDGNEMYVDWWFDYNEEDDTEGYSYYFDYLDVTYTMPVVYSETSLFKSVEITDCVVVNSPMISSITYELTYQNDEKISFTREFTEEENILMLLGLEINAVDGYFVDVSLSLGDFYADELTADEYVVTVTAGDHHDTYSYENPNAQRDNIIFNVIKFFMEIISRFNRIFDIIFLF